MINMIKAEHLKYKRTFSQKFPFIMPAYILVYGLSMDKFFFSNSMNWWTLAFMPFLISILCVLVTMRENKSGRYKTLKSKYISLKKMWVSKIVVIGYYTFISSVIVIINFLIIKIIFSLDSINVQELLIGNFTIWITMLMLIPINLFFAEKLGAFGAIAITCIGIVAGVLCSTTNWWYLCPWSISLRLMCPILKMNPNGLPLEASDPLLNSSVIPVGFIVSVIALIILCVITSLWFDKREGN